MKLYSAKIIQLSSWVEEVFKVRANDETEARSKVHALYGDSLLWHIVSVSAIESKPYQAVVKVGAQLWTIPYLDGDTMEEHAQAIRNAVGNFEYEIIHYAPIECVDVCIEDIILN